MPFRAFYENLVEFGEGRISYHFSSCIRIWSAQSWTISKRFEIVMTQSKGVKDHISNLVWDLGIVSHAQGEFRGILLHSSFNSLKPQLKL